MPSESLPPTLEALAAAAPLWGESGDFAPMLASERARPFSAAGWLFELKIDGFRLLATRRDRCLLRFRRGTEVTSRFPEVAQAIESLGVRSLALDGELAQLGADGRPDFEAMQRRGLAHGREPWRGPSATLFAFDLLALDGRDLRTLPLRDRKRLLREVLPTAGPVRYLDHVETDGELLFEIAARQGLEGVVAKRADAPYCAGRSRAWLKIKAERTADLVIVGIAPPSRDTFAMCSLLLASRSPEGLRYAGRVAVGATQLAALRHVSQELLRRSAACLGAPRSAERWLEPLLVCEVRFLCWTGQGLLRHPVFLRFRPDKRVEDCHDASKEREDPPR